MVMCAAQDRARQSFKTDPLLIVEALSPSTAARDRGKKFASYRLLPTLQHVVFIDPRRSALITFNAAGIGGRCFPRTPT